MREVSPSHLVGTLTIVAVVGGISGAKLFHILENLGAFFDDPLGMIFSVGGLTFYGGLIVAALSVAAPGWRAGRASAVASMACVSAASVRRRRRRSRPSSTIRWQ